MIQSLDTCLLDARVKFIKMPPILRTTIANIDLSLRNSTAICRQHQQYSRSYL
ncbi:hypothetical protein Elgi_59180 [Paenibacillus elgii]|nr:hypothetical protein Elgi_59180 [Paenibacillus elgii]